MKTLLLVLTAAAVALAVNNGILATKRYAPPIPDWYYSSPCQQPEGTTLDDWLRTLPWHGELELGGWDCTQLSAYVEWLTENCGYDTVIVCREGTEDVYGHCWLDIEGQPYEATGFYWIDLNTADPTFYDADLWFQDVWEAWAFDPQESEWAWWITYPILRGAQ